jgi:GT2 family glycosyltransferase
MPTVSAVIPTWNRADLLRNVIENLQAQSEPPGQIIVVDNGSQDDSCDVARRFGADLLAFSENRGFAVAVNEGIRRATGDWILIVNNDVVLQRNWLANALRTAKEESALFVVGKLLRPNGKDEIDGSWDLISRAAYAWRSGYGKPDGPVWSTRRRVHSAPMTAALFHHSVFDQIGLLETRFESYYEDVDFGIRCALANLSGIYEPAAIATHMSKTTLGKSSYRVYFLSARNQVLILAKYYSAKTLLRFAWPILVGQLLSLLAAARHRNFIAALCGKWAALKLWKHFRTTTDSVKRRQIESAFSHSEWEIRSLQKQVGFDPYWKLYFSLVGPE